MILGSHACRAGMLMLEQKSIPYETAEIPSGFQPFVTRLRGFQERTVPALTMNRSRVQTNRRIARFLDELAPDRPLLPRERREEIEEAERFADEVLQPIARRLVLWAGARDLGSLVDHGDSGRLGPILARGRRRRSWVMKVASRYFGIDDYVESLDVAALPGVLDQVDAWIRAGVLNGPEPNAADLQIAPSICLLAYRYDIRDEVASRPAWQLADRLVREPAI